MDFSMECLKFVNGTLDGCLCFCMGKSNRDVPCLPRRPINTESPPIQIVRACFRLRNLC